MDSIHQYINPTEMPKIGKIGIEFLCVEQIKKNIVSLGIIVIHFHNFVWCAKQQKAGKQAQCGGMSECSKQRMKR